MTDPSSIVTNAGSAAGFLILLIFVGRTVLDWWRGGKKLENELRTSTLTGTIDAYTLLKGMFSELKLQVAELESAIQTSKRREAETLAEHRAEIASLKRQYSEQIESLQQEVGRLRRRLQDYEME